MPILFKIASFWLAVMPLWLCCITTAKAHTYQDPADSTQQQPAWRLKAITWPFTFSPNDLLTERYSIAAVYHLPTEKKHLAWLLTAGLERGQSSASREEPLVWKAQGLFFLPQLEVPFGKDPWTGFLRSGFLFSVFAAEAEAHFQGNYFDDYEIKAYSSRWRTAVLLNVEAGAHYKVSPRFAIEGSATFVPLGTSLRPEEEAPVSMIPGFGRSIAYSEFQFGLNAQIGLLLFLN